jgi:hypothetical protein
MSIKTIRIKVPSEEYYKNKDRLIKSFIGTDAKIQEISKLDFVFDNNVVIDVKYTNLTFDPCKLYYVNTAEMKTLEINSDKKLAEIDGETVAITIPPKYKNLSILPIYINRCIKNEFQSNNVPYEYYGMISMNPLHNYCTNLSAPGTKFTVNEEGIPDTLKSTLKNIFTEEQITKCYEDVLKSSPHKNFINKIDKINSSKDIKFNNETAYIIDVNEVFKLTKGVIYCAKYRNIFDVLYIPTLTTFLTVDDFNTLKSFMYHEYLEYKTFIEKMKQ